MDFERVIQRSLIKYFIQVGACDGMRRDPIYKHVCQGNWTGILIEPLVEQFKILKKNYKNYHNLIFENIAIHKSEEEVILYIDPNDHSRSSVLRCNGRLRKLSDKKLKKRQVPAMTLNAVIEKHSFYEIDLLQIDVEGYDFGVLESLSLDKYAPMIIHYENKHLKRRRRCKRIKHRRVYEKCKNLLERHGYLIFNDGTDDIAILKKKLDLSTTPGLKSRGLTE